MKAPAPDSRRPVVLMVDDEAVSRTLLEHCLTKTRHRAVVAESAAAAWRRIAEFGPGSFDCLVTDGKMPGGERARVAALAETKGSRALRGDGSATTERE